MNTKLTLSLDKDVIEKAKEYAKEHQMSLSKMIEIMLMKTIAKTKNYPSSKTDAIIGMLEDPGPDFDYDEARYQYLKEKYNL